MRKYFSVYFRRSKLPTLPGVPTRHPRRRRFNDNRGGSPPRGKNEKSGGSVGFTASLQQSAGWIARAGGILSVRLFTGLLARSESADSHVVALGRNALLSHLAVRSPAAGPHRAALAPGRSVRRLLACHRMAHIRIRKHGMGRDVLPL